MAFSDSGVYRTYGDVLQSPTTASLLQLIKAANKLYIKPLVSLQLELDFMNYTEQCHSQAPFRFGSKFKAHQFYALIDLPCFRDLAIAM